MKLSDCLIQDYGSIFDNIASIKKGKEVKPALIKMVNEITVAEVCNRVVRPSTPLMKIPEHKLLDPSDATQDHMILPNLSVREA